MTERAIASFELDADGDWVAVLVCGHTQHVRHRPPFEVREWVTTEAGRAGRIGSALDCDFCEMPTLPADAVQELSLTDEKSVVTDPETMRPSSARSERLIRVVGVDPDTGERETHEQLERHEYEFDWGAK